MSDILPHVTVQCPVYKEGLWSVIDPTVMSLKAAISTYEMQGGTANIFVNDDGMQLIPEDEARERREYYEEHNIGWVARPRHNPKGSNGEKGFNRAGKFKKASNMNYAMNVSARVEDKLTRVRRPGGWTQEEEEQVYNSALAEIIAEDQGRTWAEGDLRIGDYILIIDSDTRVPHDCFYDVSLLTFIKKLPAWPCGSFSLNRFMLLAVECPSGPRKAQRNIFYHSSGLAVNLIRNIIVV